MRAFHARGQCSQRVHFIDIQGQWKKAIGNLFREEQTVTQGRWGIGSWLLKILLIWSRWQEENASAPNLDGWLFPEDDAAVRMW